MANTRALGWLRVQRAAASAGDRNTGSGPRMAAQAPSRCFTRSSYFPAGETELAEDVAEAVRIGVLGERTSVARIGDCRPRRLVGEVALGFLDELVGRREEHDLTVGLEVVLDVVGMTGELEAATAGDLEVATLDLVLPRPPA